MTTLHYAHYDKRLPVSGQDVQARRGCGAAERLHASCRHLVAVTEVQLGESGQAAESEHSLVGDVVAVEQVERSKGCHAAHCCHRRVVLLPPNFQSSTHPYNGSSPNVAAWCAAAMDARCSARLPAARAFRNELSPLIVEMAPESASTCRRRA